MSVQQNLFTINDFSQISARNPCATTPYRTNVITRDNYTMKRQMSKTRKREEWKRSPDIARIHDAISRRHVNRDLVRSVSNEINSGCPRMLSRKWDRSAFSAIDLYYWWTAITVELSDCLQAIALRKSRRKKATVFMRQWLLYGELINSNRRNS